MLVSPGVFQYGASSFIGAQTSCCIGFHCLKGRLSQKKKKQVGMLKESTAQVERDTTHSSRCQQYRQKMTWDRWGGSHPTSLASTQGHWAVCQRFWSTELGDVTGIWWVEAGDTAQHLRMHRTVPPQPRSIGPKVPVLLRARSPVPVPVGKLRPLHYHHQCHHQLHQLCTY